MEWIEFDIQKPPNAEDVLVIKQYLDAPYGEDGYEDGKEFRTPPQIEIDSYWSDGRWFFGGIVTRWMKLPQPPTEKHSGESCPGESPLELLTKRVREIAENPYVDKLEP